jgi:ABC-type transport system involved in multi-copper enzyme maturation permease subunit
MIRSIAQVSAIAGKEIQDARRTHLLAILTGFLLLAAMVSLTVSAIAMQAEFATYLEARDFLIAAGKSASDLVPPAFFPMKLLRGFIEHVEIIGAVLGIVLGYRSAAVERGHSTLALLMTRPMSQTTLIAGKLLGNAILIAIGLTATFAMGAATLALMSGVGLAASDYFRIFLVLVAASSYVTCFFMFGFALALGFKHVTTALLVAFAVWISLVLIAPQIGDTMDPDNQVAGGVFKSLGIPKPLEKEILKSFASYETIRDGIEQASPAKHLERLSFAILGIKDIYNGQPLDLIVKDRMVDVWWMLGTLFTMLAVLFLRPINISKLAKEQ